jgi:hypothetical protein
MEAEIEALRKREEILEQRMGPNAENAIWRVEHLNRQGDLASIEQEILPAEIDRVGDTNRAYPVTRQTAIDEQAVEDAQRRIEELQAQERLEELAALEERQRTEKEEQERMDRERNEREARERQEEEERRRADEGW